MIETIQVVNDGIIHSAIFVSETFALVIWVDVGTEQVYQTNLTIQYAKGKGFQLIEDGETVLANSYDVSELLTKCEAALA